MDLKLPFIIEADDEEPEEYVRQSQLRRVPLLCGAASPARRPRLSPLMGEELRPISARFCRVPVQDGRGRSPSPQPPANEELKMSPSARFNGDLSHRPAKLLMSTLPCASPLSLSPR